MAYEKIKLVVAGVSGEIYMTNILKDGFMGNQRRIATSDCLDATTEWFIRNKKTMVQYGVSSKGETPTLFFTDDKEKANRILAILQEEG